MPTDAGSTAREPRSRELAQRATEMLEAAGLGGGDPEDAQTVGECGSNGVTGPDGSIGWG